MQMTICNVGRPTIKLSDTENHENPGHIPHLIYVIFITPNSGVLVTMVY